MFTRAQLALFGQVPWRAVPVMPVEIMHLPRWFPFHLSKVSYWSRTVIVPLLVLMALRPLARNPRGVGIPELFRTPPERVRDWIRGPYRSAWGRFFKGVDVAAARGRAAASPRSRAAAPSHKRGRLRHRAAERRGRARRDLSRDGQQRDDVRRARLRARPPRRGDRLGLGAQAAGGRRPTAPIASPACRRSGTRASPATRSPRPTAPPRPASMPPAPGCATGRSTT